MPIRNLNKIFDPSSVAVVGASDRDGSVGHMVLRNLKAGEFTGPLYPVNTKYDTVGGLKCYSRIAELPEVDLAVLCTPAATIPQLVRECGEKGIRGLIVISAGFREIGQAGKELEHAVLDEARKFDGMRILGPNCLGILSPHVGLNASFANAMPDRGRIAFISQSGALCTAVLDWALNENIGFSHFVSVGNMLDVGIGDLIDYFATDGRTESMILYVESITEAREFMSAARAFARAKPIIAYKAGRFEESAKAAASHTGAMAGVDSVYQAAFNRAGVVRVFQMEDMFDCAELLARQNRLHGPRLAIVSNAGGPCVMATDALLERNGVLATLSGDTITQLNEFLPASWSHANPVDVLGDAPPERLAHALKVVMADDGVDAVLILFAPQAMSEPTRTAEAVIEVCKDAKKPVLTSWMGGVSMVDAIGLFNEAGLPSYSAPEQAVRAFMYLVSYARNREVLQETPREIPVEFPLDRGKLRAVFNTILSEGHDVLTESTSKALLDAYEIPVTKPFVARSAEEAVAFATQIGYPVALKVFSQHITHKTEVDGVVLDLATDAEVSAAFDRIVATAAERRPDAYVEGATVQRMVSHPTGIELIVGAKRDPVFGTVLLVGAGGTSAELFQDRALELPPLNERLTRRMLESLRSWPLLNGYRGRPAVNVDRLIEILMRLSYLVADYPEIAELDVNPLLVTTEDAIALDARIVLDRQVLLHPVRAYSHLAIRPYPEEYIKQAVLKDSSPILLRPIKPEDEPLWHEMLASCSKESIWFRFRYLFKETTHEMGARFCFIDYDREIAIVAEVGEGENRKLVGVGRLVADADHREAEYAVLVSDDYQGRGLGSLLTDYCLEICERWGIQKVTAEMSPENHRIIDIFDRRGFEIDRRESPDAVLARKQLTSDSVV